MTTGYQSTGSTSSPRLCKCYSVCVHLLNTSLSSSCCLYLPICICPSMPLLQGFVLFSAAVNLFANTHNGASVWGQALSFWLLGPLRMLEPETNPILREDPQTITGPFNVSPQIPHLFRMKTKINLMTSIQCGLTVRSFFPSQRVFSLQIAAFLYKGIFNFAAFTRMSYCVLTLLILGKKKLQ